MNYSDMRKQLELVSKMCQEDSTITSQDRQEAEQHVFEEYAKSAMDDIFNAINMMSTGDQLGRALADAALRQHRTLQQGFLASFVFTLIQRAAQAKKEGHVDGRCEYTYSLCEKLYSVLEREGAVFNGKVHAPFI